MEKIVEKKEQKQQSKHIQQMNPLNSSTMNDAFYVLKRIYKCV